MHAWMGTKPERSDALTSLIFPTYNPGSLLERTWSAVIQFLQQSQEAWEVIFVCDGCTDGTAECLRDWAGETAMPIRVLTYGPNRGKGYALRTGLAAAQGSWRIFTDVDLAYGFDDIRQIASRLRQGADVAVASRTHPESRVNAPVRLQGYVYRRHLQSKVFSGLVQWLLPVRQTDTQAGLKGLSARAARLLVPQLHCDGFEFDCELLTACARHGLAVSEVPICVCYEHQSSTTSWRSTLRMLRALWRIRKSWPKPLELPAGWETGDENRRREAA
jgi:dolichyl-phosphate beta-glucosyltransferase